jgi:uncharacterized protein YciI
MMIPALLVTALLAQAAAPQAAPAPGEMMTYQMVLLKKGPTPAPESAEARQKLADEHLGKLAELNRKRVNVLYGPVTDVGHLLGMAILAVSSADEAKKIFDDDPLVKSGVMVAEVRPWMGPKDWFKLPASYDVMNPANQDHLVLGFLVRPSNAPTLDPATSQDLQKKHLAYMEYLNQQGKLPTAGPFADNTSSRGLVIYRVTDVDAAKALAAEDPLVKAGRLQLEAYPWMTLKGILK